MVQLRRAYNIKIKSVKELKEAWNTNKDFQSYGMFDFGRMINKADYVNLKMKDDITFRYDQDRKVTILKHKELI